MFGGQRRFNSEVDTILNKYFGIVTDNRNNPRFDGSWVYQDKLSELRRIKRLNADEAAVFIAANYWGTHTESDVAPLTPIESSDLKKKIMSFGRVHKTNGRLSPSVLNYLSRKIRTEI